MNVPENKQLSNKDVESINKILNSVQDMRRMGASSKMAVALDCGDEAVIYHMGKDNPVIRIDLRFKEA